MSVWASRSRIAAASALKISTILSPTIRERAFTSTFCSIASLTLTKMASSAAAPLLGPEEPLGLFKKTGVLDANRSQVGEPFEQQDFIFAEARLRLAVVSDHHHPEHPRTRRERQADDCPHGRDGICEDRPA